jgi:hypothetical protein
MSFRYFPAVGISCQQQDLQRGCQHEHRSDDRLLDIRPAFLGPGKKQCAEKRGRERGALHRNALSFPAKKVGCDHADSCDLRDRDVDENDAPVQHLYSQRCMGCGHQQTREQGGQQQADFEVAHIIFSPP